MSEPGSLKRHLLEKRAALSPRIGMGCGGSTGIDAAKLLKEKDKNANDGWERVLVGSSQAAKPVGDTKAAKPEAQADGKVKHDHASTGSNEKKSKPVQPARHRRHKEVVPWETMYIRTGYDWPIPDCVRRLDMTLEFAGKAAPENKPELAVALYTKDMKEIWDVVIGSKHKVKAGGGRTSKIMGHDDSDVSDIDMDELGASLRLHEVPREVEHLLYVGYRLDKAGKDISFKLSGSGPKVRLENDLGIMKASPPPRTLILFGLSRMWGGSWRLIPVLAVGGQYDTPNAIVEDDLNHSTIMRYLLGEEEAAEYAKASRARAKADKATKKEKEQEAQNDFHKNQAAAQANRAQVEEHDEVSRALIRNSAIEGHILGAPSAVRSVPAPLETGSSSGPASHPVLHSPMQQGTRIMPKPASQEASLPAAEASAGFCMDCGTARLGSQKFCGDCGKAFPERTPQASAASKFCRQCGTQRSDASQKFCGECGTGFQDHGSA